MDIVLNVLLYMPIGAGLAIAGVRYRNALLALSASSLFIELLQWTVIPGRDGSVGDVVTNSLGAALGFFVGAHLEVLLWPSPREARILVVSWLGGWIALQATAAYAMQPSPTRRPYYGQLARALGEEQAYPGKIRAVTLDREQVPDRDIHASRALHDALSRSDGAQLDVTMDVPRGPTHRPSVVRIADDREEEILGLAAEGRDLVFDIRTKAADLRLRGPVFRIDSILPPDGDRSSSSAVGSIRVRARYALPAITLSATRNGRLVERRFAPGPGDGWRLIALANHLYDDTAEERMAAAAWLLLLMLPAGYWLRSHQRERVGAGERLLRAPLAALCTALPVGLWLVPAVFHMAAAAWWEIAGAVAGIALGAVTGALASRTRTWRLIRSGAAE